MTPRYVFLDQNHWIYLAKAFWGNPHKLVHQSIPAEILSQVERDSIRLPLSVIHLIEHLRAERHERREHLAAVFERFSRGWFVAPWTDVVPVEISRAVAEAFGAEHTPPSSEIFGRGFLFGVSAKARAELLKRWTAKDVDRFSWLAEQPRALFDLLTFPNESGRARQNQRICELGQLNVLAAEELRTVRKPYDKDMHRRAQYARYTFEHQDRICAALASIGRTLDDFMALGVAGLTQFWSRVPSLDVDCELTLYRDRQWTRRVQANDARDIGHLVLAVPYCDIVVTERFWARALQDTGLARKHRVAVCDDLAELPTLLAS